MAKVDLICPNPACRSKEFNVRNSIKVENTLITEYTCKRCNEVKFQTATEIIKVWKVLEYIDVSLKELPTLEEKSKLDREARKNKRIIDDRQLAIPGTEIPMD
ncbi:MAG: hypothetical protein SOX56_11540 [[Pasteurella] mairii]|nr:hypothetical protein [[Pasteurella] mairii]